MGQALVAALELWATARGLEEVAVRSNVTRVESHPFHERAGYVRVKTSHIDRNRSSSRTPRPEAGTAPVSR